MKRIDAKDLDYLQNGGMKCPKCGAEGCIKSSIISLDGPVAYATVRCEGCGWEGTDVLELVGIEEMQDVRSEGEDISNETEDD